MLQLCAIRNTTKVTFSSWSCGPCISSHVLPFLSETQLQGVSPLRTNCLHHFDRARRRLQHRPTYLLQTSVQNALPPACGFVFTIWVPQVSSLLLGQLDSDKVHFVHISISGKTSEDVAIAVDCLQIMIGKRKRQVCSFPAHCVWRSLLELNTRPQSFYVLCRFLTKGCSPSSNDFAVCVCNSHIMVPWRFCLRLEVFFR